MTKDEFVAILLLMGFRQGVFPASKNKYFKTFYLDGGVPTHVNVRVSKKASSVRVNYRRIYNPWRSYPTGNTESAIRFIQRKFL